MDGALREKRRDVREEQQLTLAAFDGELKKIE
jgi:hypothetical protein